MTPGRLQGATEPPGADCAAAAQHYTGDLGRMVDPAEVAVLVSTLASPKGAGISGAALSVDGGFTQY